MRQKGIAGIFVLVLILVVAVAGGAYYLGRTTTKPQVTGANQATPTTPLPSRASATEGDKTANWKTYTNTKYSYSVRYPPEWNVYELVAHRDFEVNSTIESNRVDFAKEGQPFPLKNDYWVWVSVVPNTNQLSTKQAVDNYLNEKATYKDGQWISINDMPEVARSITKDYLTISGTDAISLYPVPSATDTKHVYTATKKNIYLIDLQAGSLPDLNQEAMGTFNLILSTFKFTPQ